MVERHVLLEDHDQVLYWRYGAVAVGLPRERDGTWAGADDDGHSDYQSSGCITEQAK
jgi:hypothetical protein